MTKKRQNEPQPCHTCIHYNKGNGDIDCLFCDPDFEDRWSDEEDGDKEQGLNRID